MPRRTLRALALAALTLAACSAKPTIRTETSPMANFAGYRSYGWVPISNPPPIGERLTGLTDWRIRNDVDADLMARGWAQRTSGDVLVDYGVAVEEMSTDSFQAYGRYVQEGGRQGLAGAFVEGFQQGTLVIHFYDGRSGQLVWRGAATAIMNQDGGDNADVLRQAIQNMLAQLPKP